MVITELPFGTGLLGLCPLPGRDGDLAGDLTDLAEWSPRYVVTLTGTEELHNAGLDHYEDLITETGAEWVMMPITDYGIPGAAFNRTWPGVSKMLIEALDKGERVLVHCKGGCGRTGMIAYRMMLDAGEAAKPALARLRAARPCAIETDRQMDWSLGRHLIL
jgi:protein-tyrosine phosphatase